jgi:hypothetical protein
VSTIEAVRHTAEAAGGTAQLFLIEMASSCCTLLLRLHHFTNVLCSSDYLVSLRNGGEGLRRAADVVPVAEAKGLPAHQGGGQGAQSSGGVWGGSWVLGATHPN